MCRIDTTNLYFHTKYYSKYYSNYFCESQFKFLNFLKLITNRACCMATTKATKIQQNIKDFYHKEAGKYCGLYLVKPNCFKIQHHSKWFNSSLWDFSRVCSKLNNLEFLFWRGIEIFFAEKFTALHYVQWFILAEWLCAHLKYSSPHIFILCSLVALEAASSRGFLCSANLFTHSSRCVSERHAAARADSERGRNAFPQSDVYKGEKQGKSTPGRRAFEKSYTRGCRKRVAEDVSEIKFSSSVIELFRRLPLCHREFAPVTAVEHRVKCERRINAFSFADQAAISRISLHSCILRSERCLN